MKLSITLILSILWIATTYGQIGIGTETPNSTLEIKSSNQASPSNEDGILIPKADEFPSTDPTAAQDGMLLFITGSGSVTKGFYFWNNGIADWESIIFSKNYNDLTNTPTIITPTGLEKLADGNGTSEGFRLIGRALMYHGSLGAEAVDLSYSSQEVAQAVDNPFRLGNGAMGDYSFTSGFNTRAEGYATTAMGNGTIAQSAGCFSIGQWNVGGGNPQSFVLTDPIFEIGNGPSPFGRSNALTVLRNGHIGIGTENPVYPLHITEWVGGLNTTPAYYLNASIGYGSDGVGWTYSIGASRGIFSSIGFATGSDKRIKNILNISDSKADLEKLLKLEITEYSFKDHISKGNRVSKKVIAQQVREILPNAINLTTEFIPNIYEIAKVSRKFEEGAELILSKDYNIEIGEILKLITKENTEIRARVTEAEGKNVVVNFTRGTLDDEIFVYGKEVDDFHSVDYDAISMLNVSATQEQQKRINSLEEEVTLLKKELNAIKSLIQDLDSLTSLTSEDE